MIMLSCMSGAFDDPKRHTHAQTLLSWCEQYIEQQYGECHCEKGLLYEEVGVFFIDVLGSAYLGWGFTCANQSCTAFAPW